MAAARATLAVMEAEDVCGRARRAGARLADGLAALGSVRAVRGAGLLLAAQLESAVAADVAARALAEGLLVNAVAPDAIRLAPPLLVTDTEIDEALGILASAIDGAGEPA
jgi:acetylornithine/succinyldiaminopimelate/putrescine aminotransferase